MRRITPTVFALLLGVAPPALAVIPESTDIPAPLPDSPAAPHSLAAVIELIKKGDVAAALKGAREFVKAQPGSALGHEVHGIAAAAARQPREAEGAFTEALRLEPRRLSVMLRLGQLALGARDPKRAEGWFRKALAADPDLAGARRGLVVALLRQRQVPQAMAEAQEALKRSGGADLDARYLIAQIYTDTGRPAEAEPILDEILARAPDALPALLLQGLVKLELRRAEEAAALFEKVVQRDPASPGARMGLAIIERSRGQLAEAATRLQGVARDRPEWALAHFELGRTLLARRDIEAALRAFDRAERASPDPAVARVRAAQALFVAGEADRAATRARASLGSASAAPLARALLTRIHLARGTPESAERELLSAATATPPDLSALMQLGHFYLQQRRPAEAVRRFEEAAQLRPTAPEPLAGLVDAYVALGQAEPAVAAGERLLRVQGETAGAHHVFGVINEKVGRPEEALAAYARALDKEPYHLMAARARASLLQRQARREEAVRLLEDTARARPKSALPLLDLARLHERAGNIPAAVEGYRRALVREPRSAGLMNNLAYLLSRDPARRDEALALAERAHATAPGSPSIADTLGWILYEKGDLARAERLLVQAARAAPGEGTIRYHLGLLYARQGKVEEARRELSEALKARSFAEAAEARKALEALR